MVNLDDWRLTDQEKYLMGVTLSYRRWFSLSSTWEHDHCEFCNIKFSDKITGCLTTGYTTIDNYRWICPQCFTDFKDIFFWKVVMISDEI